MISAHIVLLVKVLLTFAMVALGAVLRRNCTWGYVAAQRRRNWSIVGIIVTQVAPLPFLGVVIYLWCVCLLTMSIFRLYDFKKPSEARP